MGVGVAEEVSLVVSVLVIDVVTVVQLRLQLSVSPSANCQYFSDKNFGRGQTSES